MKKIICFILIFLTLASAVSCGGDDSTTTTGDSAPVGNEDIHVVHPEYEISALVDNTRFSSIDGFVNACTDAS